MCVVAMDIVFTSMGSNLSTMKIPWRKTGQNVMSFYDDPIILPPSPCSDDAHWLLNSIDFMLNH